QAGYFEISGSGNYRKTTYDENNYSIYRSGTAAVAYYFWELSALEISYTKARTDDVKTDYVARSYVTFYGADLIFTLASKQSLFQPYIKVGAAYQDKNGTYKQTNQLVTALPEIKGWAPTGGIGFKIILGKHIAIKTGIDAWSSPLSQENVTYDYAARLGLSFIF
ncbi:MAG: hypothetical protein V4596_07995, partial [Bdellovibrionota bacterium]